MVPTLQYSAVIASERSLRAKNGCISFFNPILTHAALCATSTASPGSHRSLNRNEYASLVLAVGAELKNQFRDGVWLIALGETADPVSVPQLIANALHVHSEADRNLVVTLGEFLRERNALLILDHCSNLSGACAQFTQAVLQRCPEVSLLVASDRPLGIANESVFSIPNRAPSGKAKRPISYALRQSAQTTRPILRDGPFRLCADPE